MLDRLRRLASQAGPDRIHELLQQSDPVAAARWRDATSDAGRYLLGLAKWDERIGYLFEREADIRSAIERVGFWEECVEWRIATESTNRVERDGSTYRVSTECDGTYAATVRSVPLALEAGQVLFGLRRDLFYEVGWASWREESVEHEIRKPISHGSRERRCTPTGMGARRSREPPSTGSMNPGTRWWSSVAAFR